MAPSLIYLQYLLHACDRPGTYKVLGDSGEETDRVPATSWEMGERWFQILRRETELNQPPHHVPTNLAALYFCAPRCPMVPTALCSITV